MNTALVITGIGLLIFLAYLFSALFKRTSIPDVLPLFLVGLLLGPVSGTITPEMIGESGQLFATITLVIVLFVGGLNIHIGSLIRSFSRTFLLMFLNLLGTVLVVVTGAWLIFGIHPLLGAVVGILVGGTSSAVVIPVANQLRLRPDSRALLALESNLNVVFSVVLALALWDIWQGRSVDLAQLPLSILSVFLVSVAVGVLAALLWSRVLGSIRLLKNSLLITPAFLLVVYGLAELAGATGAIACFAFGITLGNLSSIRLAPVSHFAKLTEFRLTQQERIFFSVLTFLFKTFFFVYMGLVMDLSQPKYLLWGLAVMLVLFVWRFVLTGWLLNSTVPKHDLAVIRGMLPKGLVGAAVLALLGAPILEQLAYPIILMSIVLTSVFLTAIRYFSLPGEEDQPGEYGLIEGHLPGSYPPPSQQE